MKVISAAAPASIADEQANKKSALVATTGNIDLASAPATIDAVSPADGKRILAWLQSDNTENGVYIYNGVGNAMTRAPDVDEDAEIACGQIVLIREGATYADKTFKMTSDNVVIGTDPMIFALAPPDEVLTQNTFFVDTDNGSTGVEGSRNFKYPTIQLAVAAVATTGDAIDIANGNFPEAIDLLGKTIRFIGPGVTGLLPMVRNGGTPLGVLGNIEYHANGAIVSPSISDTASADDVDFAIDVGLQQSAEKFLVSVWGGANYDFVARNISLTGTNGELISLKGLGKPNFLSTIESGFILYKEGTNIQGIGGQVGSSTAHQFLVNSSSNSTGDISNIGAPLNRVTLSTGAGSAFNGTGRNIMCHDLLCNGTLVDNDPTISGVSANGQVLLDDFGGLIEVLKADIIGVTALRLTGVVDVQRVNPRVSISTATPTDILGLFKGGNYDFFGGSNLGGHFDSFISNDSSENSYNSARLDPTYILSNSQIGLFGGATGTGVNPTLIDGSKFENVIFKLVDNATRTGRFAGTINKGIFNHPTFNRVSGSSNNLRIPLSGGAVLNKPVFNGWPQNSSDPFDAATCGTDILDQNGATGQNVFWDESLSTLVFPLAAQPKESDGAGGYQDIPDLTTIKATIYELPPATGGDLTGALRLFVEFEFFLDVADVHGFGANTPTFRTTATDVVEIRAALGSPVADITPSTGSAQGSRIGMAATVFINDPTPNGATMGQELTVKEVNKALLALPLTGIDFTAVADHTIAPVPTGKKQHLTLLEIELESISGAGVNPRIQAGYNSPNFDDVIGNTMISTLAVAGDAYMAVVEGAFKVGSAGDVLTVRIDTASGATTFDASIFAHGILTDI